MLDARGHEGQHHTLHRLFGVQGLQNSLKTFQLSPLRSEAEDFTTPSITQWSLQVFPSLRGSDSRETPSAPRQAAGENFPKVDSTNFPEFFKELRQKRKARCAII